MNLPRVALSINQPWAWLVAAGHKPIENRDWNTEFRGEFAIHTGLKVDRDAAADLAEGLHPVTGVNVVARERDGWNAYDPVTGAIIGIAELVDVVTARTLDRVSGLDASWFVGRYGLVVRNARLIEPIPCVGALGFFTPDLTKTYKPKPEPKRKPARPEPPAQGALFE